MRRAVLPIVVGALLLAPVAAAPAALPRSFVGIYDETAAGLGDEAALGIGIVRQPFDWSRVERSPGVYDFSVYDDYVARAASAGMSVLPILARPPAFRSSRPAGSRSHAMYPPRSYTAYAAFVAAAVRRYGPAGSFWRAHPEVPFLPVHAWQVWNEPNIPNFWRSGVDARQYVALLRVASHAIRRVDPHAEVVAAGLPNSNLGVPFLTYLDRMYRAGARGLFDTLAIHPYSHTVLGLLNLAERARGVMNRWHDRSRLWITEFGWSTAGDASAFRVSARGQANRIAEAVSGLLAQRRALHLRGFVLFKWRDSLPPAGSATDPWPLHAGLLNADGSPKPGFWVFDRLVAALRNGFPQTGDAAATEIARRDVRVSPLGFARIVLGCRAAASDVCAGRLRLQSVGSVRCGGRRLRARTQLGSGAYAIAVAPAIASVRLSTAARWFARCARRLRVRATVGPGGAVRAASARAVVFELRGR